MEIRFHRRGRSLGAHTYHHGFDARRERRIYNIDLIHSRPHARIPFVNDYHLSDDLAVPVCVIKADTKRK